MRAWALWAAALAALAAPASGANVKATPADLEGVSIHTVFSAECTPYFDWQSLALVRSHRLVGMPGPITRLLACDDNLLANYKYRDIVPTHVHPNFNTLHFADIGDNYVPYNKPGSIKHWLENVNVTEEYVFFIDADMLFLEPFTPKMVGVKPGRAVSAAYDYLIGLDDKSVISRFLPEEHWPLMRKVGGWTMMLTDDMRRVAPLWLRYTEDVRTAPFGREVWFKMGDAYVTEENPRPWISEMYGYSFGAAHAGVDHLVNREMMLYPTYVPDITPPYLLHYGLEVKIGPTYVFDKHFFTGGDHLACPVDLFDPPPNVTQLMESQWPGGNGAPVREKERLDLAAFTVISLNDALREYGQGDGGCEQSCDPECVDKRDDCKKWGRSGECENNPSFMKPTCPLTCEACDCAPGKKGDVQAATGRGETLRGGEGTRAQAPPVKSKAGGDGEEATGTRVRPRVAAEKHANAQVREAALQATAAARLAEKARLERKAAGDDDQLAAVNEDTEDLDGGDSLRRQAELESASEELAASKRTGGGAEGGIGLKKGAAKRAPVGEAPSAETSLLLVAAPLTLPFLFFYVLSRLYRGSRGRAKAHKAAQHGTLPTSRYED